MLCKPCEDRTPGGSVTRRPRSASCVTMCEQCGVMIITLRGVLLGRSPVLGSCGIGHTRWATHGAPNDCNAHPHLDCDGALALVHNGIIENADVLRARLTQEGHRFATETDTETLAHLIEDSPGATLEARVIAALGHRDGTYGVAVIAETEPGKIVVARRGAPVLLGVGAREVLGAPGRRVGFGRQ